MNYWRFPVFWFALITLLVNCSQVRDGKQLLLLFLSWDENGRVQLYRTEIDGEAPTQLTESAADILDYAPAPEGGRIAFSTGNALWLWAADGRSPHQLLACPTVKCDQIVWHPDGRRLLYERTGPDSPPHLWWLNSETGETVPLQADSTGPSQAASFSTAGVWVSYVVSPDEGITFYNFADGRHFQLPSNLGTPAVWHPSEPSFLYRNQQLITFHGSGDDDHQGHNHDYVASMPLLWGDTANDGAKPAIISEIEVTDDASPAWSPDGAWIVFGRKLPGVENGRQLWLMRSDGSEARPLTAEPMIHHGVPSWSDDGRFILYQRYDISQPEAKPAVWLMEIAIDKQNEIVPEGFSPQWLHRQLGTKKLR